MIFWAYAVFRTQLRAEEQDRRWRSAVDEQLKAAGVFARMKAANLALGSAAFAVAINEASEERRVAKDENDIAAIARRILDEMSVDRTDIVIRLRRAQQHEIPRWMRRQGGAQLRMSAKPTPEAAQRAIDAAAAAGYPVPGSFDAGAVVADEAEARAEAELVVQAGQGNIGT